MFQLLQYGESIVSWKKQVISFGIPKTYCPLLAKRRTNKGKISRSSAGLPAEARFDRQNHLLGSKTQGQCKICKKNTKMSVTNVTFVFLQKEESSVSKIITTPTHHVNKRKYNYIVFFSQPQFVSFLASYLLFFH